MTTNTYKFGERTKLILGTGPFNVSGQLRAGTVSIKEEVKVTEAVPVADGSEIPKEEEVEYSATLKGKFLQALELDGVVDWTWEHRGEWVDFVLVPDTAVNRACYGKVRVAPIDLGGEVNKPRTRPESDFEWAARAASGVAGTVPIFGVYDPVDGDVTEDV